MRADTSVPIHSVIATRRSPRAFVEGYLIPREDQIAILEAARWAPSAFNGQPWRFLVGNHGDETFTQILSSLGEFNQNWAKRASTLILVASTTVKADGTPHGGYLYDCGLAVSQLVFEAHDRGLVAHQMTGFNKDIARSAVGLPDALVPVVVIALGKQGAVDTLPPQLAEREVAPRQRLPLDEIVIKGLPS